MLTNAPDKQVLKPYNKQFLPPKLTKNHNMTIEISKKAILIVAIVLVAAGALYGCYSIGYESGYDSGVEETKEKYENPKGNGNNFFAEEFVVNQGQISSMFGETPINRTSIVYHSTPNCPAIENGVKMDVALSDSTSRVNNSSFCPKCMDEVLIRKCQDFLDSFDAE